MSRGPVIIRIVLFLLFTTCIALCQSSLLPVEQNSLPDAPLPALPQSSEAANCRSLIRITREGCTGFGAGVSQVFVHSQLEPYAPAPRKSEVGSLLVRYLSPPSLQQDATPLSTTNGVIWRTSYAVSHILLTHDGSGKTRPNTAYLLQVLTAAAFHTAYRPNRARTPSSTFDGVRSTISSDAGEQVFHEFRPDIMHVVNRLKFVSRIEQHVVAHSQPSMK